MATSSEKDPLSRKHYIPLESDPEIFTSLIHNLGVNGALAFQDALSLDDPDLIAFVPRPVLALILVFPSDAYKVKWTEEEAQYEEYDGCGEAEDIIWFKQTIHNACGLYGILHAVSNAGDYICKIPRRRFLQLIAASPCRKADIEQCPNHY